MWSLTVFLVMLVSSNSTVAGVGMGSMPCAVFTWPRPSGRLLTDQVVATASIRAAASIRYAAPTMSAIESHSPSSWKLTVSMVLP